MAQNSFQEILNKQKQEQAIKQEQQEMAFNPYEEKTAHTSSFRKLLDKNKEQKEPKKTTSFSLKYTTLEKMDELVRMLRFSGKTELLEEIIKIAYEDLKEEGTI